jgi:hypothetical protein
VIEPSPAIYNGETWQCDITMVVDESGYRITSQGNWRRVRGHKITFHPGDFWGDKGCSTCGKPLKIVSIWDRGRHFWAHA